VEVPETDLRDNGICGFSIYAGLQRFFGEKSISDNEEVGGALGGVDPEDEPVDGERRVGGV
jgi:hypothetical protein